MGQGRRPAGLQAVDTPGCSGGSLPSAGHVGSLPSSCATSRKMEFQRGSVDQPHPPRGHSRATVPRQTRFWACTELAPGGPRHPTSAAPATGMPAQGRGVGGAGQSGPSPGLLPVFLPGGPTDTSAGSTLLQAHNAPFTLAGLVEHGHLPGVPAGFWPCAQFGGRGPVTVNHQGGFST